MWILRNIHRKFSMNSKCLFYISNFENKEEVKHEVSHSKLISTHIIFKIKYLQ